MTTWLPTVLAWMLSALPLAVGAVLGCTGRRGDRFAPLTGITTAAVTLLFAVLAAATRPSASAPLFAGVDAGVAVDGLSAVLVVTVAAVTLAVLVFSAGEPGLGARYAGLMLVFAGAMLLTVTATGLALLLMAWEVMGAASWALIGYWWREPRRVRAANVAFLTTRGADLGLYLAAGAAIAGGVDTLELADLPSAAEPWLAVLTAGVVLAALGKSAQLPFSFWLSRAMEGPSPVSALLHSATMVAAGGYLLLRLQPVLAASGWGEPVVAWAGAATVVLLGLVAVTQTDLKQLLAASTSAQLGYVVLAAGTGGVAAGTAQFVAHAATKAALFLAAGAWLTALGTKALPALRGAVRRYPVVGVAFTIAAACLAGLPPLSLWVTKDAVLAAALERSPVLYAAGLAGAGIAAVYSAKAVWFVWRPEPADVAAGWDTEEPGTRRISAFAVPALVALAVTAAVLGVLPAVLGAAWPPTWELVLSAVLAIGAAAGTWRWADRLSAAPAALRDWLGLERAAATLVVTPTMALARALAAFDDRVVHRAVLAVPAAGLRLARLADRRAALSVSGALEVIVSGSRRLGRLARRPQTGQLHQYYAQAAVGLAVLAILVVVVR